VLTEQLAPHQSPINGRGTMRTVVRSRFTRYVLLDMDTRRSNQRWGKNGGGMMSGEVRDCRSNLKGLAGESEQSRVSLPITSKIRTNALQVSSCPIIKKKRMVEQRGARTFIDVESGGWPVHAQRRGR